jgi:WhiB family redox-sensing transcriptional regulator
MALSHRKATVPVTGFSGLWPENLLPRGQWEPSAACRTADPQLFFPSTDGHGAQQPAAAAKEICRGCPVRVSCLAYAIENDEPVGIWGGLTAGERSRLFDEMVRAAHRR